MLSAFGLPLSMKGFAMISPEETARIARRLDLNERIVWVGRPKPTAFALSTVPVMIFGIGWCALVATIISTAVRDFAETLRKAGFAWHEAVPLLFFVPFVVAGVAMLGAPLWRYLIMAGQYYVVTDKRALIMGRFVTQSRRRGEMDVDVDRVDRRNGLSDLFFAASNVTVNGRPQPFGFRNLPTAEVAAAERALLDLAARRG